MIKDPETFSNARFLGDPVGLKLVTRGKKDFIGDPIFRIPSLDDSRPPMEEENRANLQTDLAIAITINGDTPGVKLLSRTEYMQVVTEDGLISGHNTSESHRVQTLVF